MVLHTYSGSDSELEEFLKPFGGSSNASTVTPVDVVVAVAAEDKDYASLLEMLKKKAEERAKVLGICENEKLYLANVKRDKKTGTMVGDLLEPTCYSCPERPNPRVKTYSKSGRELKDVLQRRLTPVEHIAVNVKTSANYGEALEELVKHAASKVDLKDPDGPVYYVADVKFEPDESAITGQIYESGRLSTCENIIPYTPFTGAQS